jgi:hypothetical protein
MMSGGAPLFYSIKAKIFLFVVSLFLMHFSFKEITKETAF